MKCSEAFQVMLEADAEELRGTGETPLARHLRECPSCAAMAEGILRGQEALSRALVEEVPSVDLDAVLDQALDQDEGLRFPSSPRLRRWGFTLIPLAAAATFAALFLGTEPPLPGEPYVPPAREAGLDLEVPESTDVAVLATSNPDITVLWFF